jgi:hypothetical protein
MKMKFYTLTLLAIGAMASLSPNAALAGEKKSQAELEAQAKVTKEEAQKTALAAVPNATVKSAELEEEKGKLIWSFDLNTPGSQNITEVGVDALSGKVVENKVETAKDEADEAKEDADKEGGKTGHHGHKK